MNSDNWIFYRDAANEWQWKRFAANGEQVGGSTEGYKNKADCIANATRNGWTEDQQTEWEIEKDGDCSSD